MYPNHKDKVVGLVVTNMYIEMLEYNTSVDELVRNYKKYVPETHEKKHSIFIKNKISKQLVQFKHKHDSW